MARKIMIGMLAVFICIGIASLGCQFGRYLATSNSSATPAQSVPG